MKRYLRTPCNCNKSDIAIVPTLQRVNRVHGTNYRQSTLPTCLGMQTVAGHSKVQLLAQNPKMDNSSSLDVSKYEAMIVQMLSNIIPRVSASLSVIGSGAVVYLILCQNRQAKLARLHYRLILCLSSFDILSSLAMLIGTVASPRNPNIYLSRGNINTCQALGFFIQLLWVAPSYNAMLCLSFLAVIRYNIKDEIIEKYEYIMHAYATLPSLCLAILGAIVYRVYQPRPYICWVDQHIPQTDSSTNVDSVSNIIYIVNKVIVILNFLIISCSMYKVYSFVQKSEQKMKKYNFRGKSSLTRRQSKNEDSSEVTKQCYLYVAAYLVCYLPATIDDLIVLIIGSRPSIVSPYMILIILMGFGLPLQVCKHCFTNSKTHVKSK